MIWAAFVAAAVAVSPMTYSDPAWSPRGDRIAFVARPTLNDAPASLETISVDGTGLRQVATLASGDLAWPSWSPDGRRLVFGYDRSYVVGADGRGLRRLRSGGCCAAWGPGGRKIAFSDGPEVQSQIYVMNPDGRRVEIVASPDDGHSYWGPTWSPDGQRLAFFVDEAPDMLGHVRTSLAVISRFRGKVRTLRSGLRASSPDWSPRGGKIAFDGIRVLDLATKRVVALHEGRHPSWSPDGRRLAFVYEDQIYVMRADGSGVRRLTQPTAR